MAQVVVAAGDLGRRAGDRLRRSPDVADQRAQPVLHAAHRTEQATELIAAIGVDRRRQIAFRDALGHADRLCDRLQHAERQAPGEQAAERDREHADADQHHARHRLAALRGFERLAGETGFARDQFGHQLAPLVLDRTHVLHHDDRCFGRRSFNAQLGCLGDQRQRLRAHGLDLLEQLALGAARAIRVERLRQFGLGARVVSCRLLEQLDLLVDFFHFGQKRQRAQQDRHLVNLLDHVVGQCHLAVAHFDDALELAAHRRHLPLTDAGDDDQQGEDQREAERKALAE